MPIMDETPEQLEQIRREADQIDVNQYRKRFRALKAVALGAAGAGLVWLALIMLDSRRNPANACATTSARRSPPASPAPATRPSGRNPSRRARPCAPTSAPSANRRSIASRTRTACACVDDAL
jgi:hypothetical protein